jgi:hypothetical protein
MTAQIITADVGFGLDDATDQAFTVEVANQCFAQQQARNGQCVLSKEIARKTHSFGLLLCSWDRRLSFRFISRELGTGRG